MTPVLSTFSDLTPLGAVMNEAPPYPIDLGGGYGDNTRRRAVFRAIFLFWLIKSESSCRPFRGDAPSSNPDLRDFFFSGLRSFDPPEDRMRSGRNAG